MADDVDRAKELEMQQRGIALNNQLERAKRTYATYLTHEGVSTEFAKTLLQVGAGRFTHGLYDVFALNQFNVGNRHRGTHGVTRVGVAMIELTTLVDQYIHDAVANHDSADRQVAG